jgi:hypothetical protein
MRTINKNIWIDRSPQDVFVFHANHANRAGWHDHVIRSEMITPPPLGLGSKFAIDTITAKRPLPMILEIIAYDPYRSYRYRSIAANAITDSQQTFIPEKGGTRFQVHIEITFRVLARPFGWFILKLGLESHFEMALQELKEEMER